MRVKSVVQNYTVGTSFLLKCISFYQDLEVDIEWCAIPVDGTLESSETNLSRKIISYAPV